MLHGYMVLARISDGFYALQAGIRGKQGDCPHAAAPGGSGVWISELGRGQDRALDLSCPLKMELSRPDKAASFV